MDVPSVTCNSNKRTTRKSINLSNAGRINHSSCTLLVQILFFTIFVSTTFTFFYVPVVNGFHFEKSLDSATSSSKSNSVTKLPKQNFSTIDAASSFHSGFKHKIRRHRDHLQQQQQQQQQLQHQQSQEVKPSKRSTDHWSKESEKTPRAFQSVLNSFKVSPNTIIR